MIRKLESENFESVAASHKNLYIIKFGSKTCGPCNTLKPVLDALAKNNPTLPIYEVDTDQSPDLAQKFDIRSVPTIHYCEDREVIYSFFKVTPLRDLQYVIDNIDDQVFRETGKFNIEKVKKSYLFEIMVILALLLLVGAYAMAAVK